MATIGPDWATKMATLTRGLEWASGVQGVWKFQADAFQAPQNNDPWFELRMRRVFAIGKAEGLDVDNIDPATGAIDVTNPRKEVAVTQVEFRCEMRVLGRDQDHDTVAWVIADTARTRMGLPYFRDGYLNKTPDPNDPAAVPSANMSVIELFDVVPMPGPEVVADRWQSEAILELRLATTTVQDDPAAVGTWIEKVEISSNLLQPDGETPLPTPLQLDDRLIDASTP